MKNFVEKVLGIWGVILGLFFTIAVTVATLLVVASFIQIGWYCIHDPYLYGDEIYSMVLIVVGCVLTWFGSASVLKGLAKFGETFM